MTIAGNITDALLQHNSVVLNETTAKKYFGSATAAIGKQFETDGNNGNNNFIITGVCKDWPHNAHFTFNMLISTTGFDFLRQENYTGFSAYTYILLYPGTSPQAARATFPGVIKKYVSGEIGRTFGQSFEEFQNAGNGYHYFLQPLKQIHLTSSLEADYLPMAAKQRYMFLV